MNKLVVIALLLSAIYACTSETNSEPEELAPMVHTLYTDSVELFVEYKPFVVGELSKFAAHFTVLGDQFTALEDATITVSLVMGENGIRNSIDSCSSPGIFRLALEPKKAGMAALIFDVKAKNFSEKFVIKNVRVFATRDEAMKHPAPEAAGDITYLKEQAWKVEFANEPTARRDFANVIKTSGQLLSAPGDEMLVVAKASGIVLFSNQSLIQGSPIKKGQTIMSISGEDLSEFNINSEYKRAKMNADKAKLDYDRASKLIEDKIITQKDFLQAKLTYENAENSYRTLSRNYSQNGKSSLSPMDGFVKNLLVQEGQYVEAGTPLATVSKNKRLVVQSMLAQNYYDQLSLITSANFTSGSNTKEVYNTKALNGSLPIIGKSSSDNSPFVSITFEIDNIGQLIPGSVIEVYLKSSPIANALVIPVSSLVEEQGTFYVYVQTGGESFQKREVRLGANDGEFVQVLKGVEENERVVTKGAYQIKLSTASGVLPAHGHEH